MLSGLMSRWITRGDGRSARASATPRGAGRPRGPETLRAREALPERLALDVRHDVVEESVGIARVEQAEDVGVLEIGAVTSISRGTARPHDRGQLGAQHLDRDLAMMLQVLGEIDRGHAALAQLPLDAVAVGQSGRESRVDGHCLSPVSFTIRSFTSLTCGCSSGSASFHSCAKRP